MAVRVGFAEADITPPLGTQLAGWLDVARPAQTLRDPVYARMMAVESDGGRVGFIALDLLSIRGSDALDIRSRVEKATGMPAGNLLIAATHNHAGPAIVSIGPFRREDAYLEWLKERLTTLAIEAWNRSEGAEVGVGVGFEGRISFNRRWVMKNGLTRCQPGVANPDVLYCEGPIDPQMGLVCARRLNGETLGYVVNWSCHPVHVYDMKTITASWPGALAREVKSSEGVPCLLLNGAFGNVHSANWVDPSYVNDPDRMGSVLADDLPTIVKRMVFTTELPLAIASKTLELPLRDISDEEVDESRRILAGEKVTLRPGVQRYGANETYATSILQLVERKKERNFSRGEVQAIRFGNAAFVGLPAESFVETGLDVKLGSPFDPTFVVGAANGMVGYAPPPASYRRGGYECTTAHWSKVAPEAAMMMAETGVALTRALSR
jgi:hypothetical protein